MGRKVLFDGQIKFNDCLNIKIDSPALNYGLGLFETVLFENSKIFFLKEHLERMIKSCHDLKLPLPRLELITESSVLELIEANEPKNNSCRIKILYAPLINRDEWNLTAVTSDYCRNNEPVSGVIEKEVRENYLSRHKTISYMQNYLSGIQNKDSETFYINSKGNLTEGSISNLICVKDDMFYFVNNQENYLNGIMQSKILSDHKNFGLRSVTAIKNGISTDLIRQCSEAVITNSLIIAKNLKTLRFDNEEITFKECGLSDKIRNFYLK